MVWCIFPSSVSLLGALPMKSRVILPAMLALGVLFFASDAKAFNLFSRLGGHGCCEPTCGCDDACEPACGCDDACEPSCGCDDDACEPACGCDNGCDAEPSCGCDTGCAGSHRCGPSLCDRIRAHMHNLRNHIKCRRAARKARHACGDPTCGCDEGCDAEPSCGCDEGCAPSCGCDN